MIAPRSDRTGRWPGWPGWPLAGCAFGLGAAMSSGQAPLGLWGLTLVALWALILLVARAPGAVRAAWLGQFAGMGYFGLSFSWIVDPFLIDPEVYGWLAPFALIGVSVGFGLFWALATGVASALDGGVRGRAALLAVTLALAELARGYLLTGFPWAMIGHVWIDTPFAQLGALIGPSGLTLLTTLAAALPVVAGAWAVPVLALMAAAGIVWAGVRPEAPLATAQSPMVRVIQPNAEQHLKWDPDRAAEFLDRNLALTAAPVAPGGRKPDLVVWPETAVPYLLNGSEGVLAQISAAAGEATAVVGIQRAEGTRAWNSMVVLGPSGQIEDIYDKHHLVPFGEYMPFGDVLYETFGITALASKSGNGFSAGPGARILDLGPRLGRALPLICYEALFPQDLRAAPGRADFLLQITNDAWFGHLTGPWQHLDQARFRAIEQGLPLIRSANTGISAVVDAKGRIVAELPLDVPGHLDAGLPGPLPITLYARTGDLPVFVLLLVLGTALALIARRRRA